MKILVVSAHPDDETLGCGGTLLKHAEAGDSLDWLITTKSGPEQYAADFIARRQIQIAKVTRAYGFGKVHELKFNATQLDSVPLSAVIDAAASEVNASQLDRVYIVHPGDVHSDHCITFNAMWAVLKPFAIGRSVEVFCYETASSSDLAAPLSGHRFLANAYSDIDAYLDRKLAIFRIYESEIQTPPGPRSLEAITALARSRGAAAGMNYAEAFAAMRVIL